jgi:hypothetical protein
MKSLIFAAALLTAGAAYAQQTVPAGNTAPEHDSRGVAVVSDPATAPAGTNEPIPTAPPGAVWRANPNPTAAFAPQASTGEKPPCSRTVTDNCTQTYEVGRRGRPRR